jgi:hypothetical protein
MKDEEKRLVGIKEGGYQILKVVVGEKSKWQAQET